MPKEDNINILHIKITSKGEFVAIEKESRYRIIDLIYKNKNNE
jgi:hypothetical protein